MKLKYLFTLVMLLDFFNSINAQGSVQIGHCDFETPAENCAIIFDTSAQNIWQIGTTQKLFFGYAHSLPNAIMTDSMNPYPTNNFSSFIIKFINNTNSTIDWNFTEISFWHKYQLDSLHDFGRMFYAFDDDTMWTSMTDTIFIGNCSYSGYYWIPSLQVNGNFGGEPNEVSGNSDDWIYSAFEWNWFFPLRLRDFCSPDTIFVRFDFVSDSAFDNEDGWIIDDISVIKQWWYGIHDPAGDITIKTYPNPATDVLYAALNGPGVIQKLILVNELNQPVKQTECQINQAKIYVADLARGNYFLRAISSDGRMGFSHVMIE